MNTQTAPTPPNPVDMLGSMGVVTLDEIARIFGTSLRSVKSWVSAADGLPTIKVGKKRFCRLESAQRWLLDRERQSNPTKRRR